MGTQCPNCGGNHTQAIRAVIQAGTTYSNGSVVGVGVGTSGAGTFAGSSSTTSQTTLAARFSEPKKPKKLEMIAGGIMSVATSPWLFSKTPLAFITIGLVAWWAWETRAYLKRSKRYAEHYPVWKNMYDYGYYCHACGNAFAVRN